MKNRSASYPHPNQIQSPFVPTSQRSMGERDDDDFMVDTTYAAPDDAHDFDAGYESGKRGRGRPKGTKNKAGHRAGRPKKIAGEEEEHGSPNRKRKRTISPHPLLGALLIHANSTPTNQDQSIESRNSLHGLHGDIPVDPALIGNASNLVGAITNSRAEEQDFATNYLLRGGSNPPNATDPVSALYFQRGIDTPAAASAPPMASTSKPHATRVANHLTDIGLETGLAGMIRTLLPKDQSEELPKVSGPFQMITTDDGRRRLDGPLSREVVEAQSTAIYIYIANYRAGPPPEPGNRENEPLPTGPMPLAAWKITHPLTSEGKDRVRGPRRCGHCGKMECRGRGGRTWCPEYQAGQEGALGKIKGNARSPSAGAKDDVATQATEALAKAVQRSSDYSVLFHHETEENGDLSTGVGVEEAAKLNDQAVMQHLIQNIHSLVPQDGSGEGHRHLFGDGFSTSYANVVNNNAYAELHQHQQEQEEEKEGDISMDGPQEEERDIFSAGNEDSLLQLQQHQLLQQQSSPDLPLAPLPSDTPDVDADPDPVVTPNDSGNFVEEEEDELLDHNIDSSLGLDTPIGASGGSARKSARAPRRCAVCKKGDCPGRTQRTRCNAAG